MKFWLLSIFLLFYAICSSQTYNSITTDQEIIDFLEWKFSNEKNYPEAGKQQKKRLFFKISQWNTASFILGSSSKPPHSRDFLFTPNEKTLDSLFTIKDREFMIQQVHGQVDSTWRHKFTDISIITKKKLPRYHLTLPVFSLNRNYVIIHESFYCGTLCAHWQFKIYKKTGEKTWEFVKDVNSWIS